MTEQEFAEIIRTVEGYWPKRRFDEHAMDVWWSQMQPWSAELVLAALPELARTCDFIPSFSQLSQGYALEVRKRDHVRETRRRHLSVVGDPEMAARWSRVITAQLLAFGTGSFARDERPVARAVRKHYRLDGTPTVGLVVLDGRKMLDDAEAALADDAFTQED